MHFRCGQSEPGHAGHGVPGNDLVHDVCSRIVGVLNDGPKSQGKEAGEKKSGSIEPEHCPIDLAHTTEHVMVMEPNHKQEHKCCQISAGCRQQMPPATPPGEFRRSQIQHHQRDDDCVDCVAEQCQPVLHSLPPTTGIAPKALTAIANTTVLVVSINPSM